MLSGFAEAAAVLDLIEKGVIYTFVAKPWNDSELRLTIKRGLEYLATRLEVVRLTAALEQVNQELGELRARRRQDNAQGNTQDNAQDKTDKPAGASG